MPDKKNIVKLVVISDVILVFVCLFCLFQFFPPDFMAAYPFAHAFPYHHKGTVTLTIDGEKQDINNTVLSFFIDSQREKTAYETDLVENDTFVFKKGEYGPNTWQLMLPHDTYPIVSSNDVYLSFGHYTHNNWHVFSYDIMIDIRTHEGGASATITQTYFSLPDKTPHTLTETVQITNEQNQVGVFEDFQ